MQEDITFISKYRRYELIFQGIAYSDSKIERYFNNNRNEKGKVEFLPGIFYSCEPIGIKKFLLALFKNCKRKSELLELLISLLLNRLEKSSITFLFENARDNYSLYINDELAFSHNKNYKGEELLFPSSNYKYIDIEPEYIEVPTEDILLPDSSGGDGSRCALKGVFEYLDLFRTDTYNAHYFFFDEYEMHCLALQSEEVKNICRECGNCTQTVNLMREGKFIGPTKENDMDGLTLGKYGDKYIIENGNHRACCAKVFGIPLVKAKVHHYKKIKDQIQDETRGQEIFDNKDILDSFYSVFSNCGITDEKARDYLKQDGSDITLIKLLNIKA